MKNQAAIPRKKYEGNRSEKIDVPLILPVCVLCVINPVQTIFVNRGINQIMFIILFNN